MGPTATYNAETNLITVSFHGETRDFEPKMDMGDSFWVPSVFSGKFRSGTKLWPCCIYFNKKTSKLIIQPGGYSNKGGVTSIVGWFDKTSSQNSKN